MGKGVNGRVGTRVHSGTAPRRKESFMKGKLAFLGPSGGEKEEGARKCIQRGIELSACKNRRKGGGRPSAGRRKRGTQLR